MNDIERIRPRSESTDIPNRLPAQTDAPLAVERVTSNTITPHERPEDFKQKVSALGHAVLDIPLGVNDDETNTIDSPTATPDKPHADQSPSARTDRPSPPLPSDPVEATNLELQDRNKISRSLSDDSGQHGERTPRLEVKESTAPYPGLEAAKATIKRVYDLFENSTTASPNGRFVLGPLGWGFNAIFSVSEGNDSEKVKEYIHKDRERLTKLTSEHREVAAELLSLRLLPQDLKEEIAGGRIISLDPTTPAQQKLYDSQLNQLLVEQLIAIDANGNHLVSDDTLLAVAADHFDRMITAQLAVDADIKPFRQEFVRRVQDIVSNPQEGRRLPQQALTNLRDRLPYFRILIDDGFCTVFNDWGGVSYRKKNGSFVDYHAAINPTNLSNTFVLCHETTHSLLEGGYEIDPEGLQAALGNEQQHSRGLDLLYEAIADFITTTIVGASPEKYNLEERRIGLTLLHTLSTGGDKQIDPVSFVNVYCQNFSEKTPPQRNPAVIRLQGELKAAFPADNIAKDLQGLIPADVSKEDGYRAVENYTKYLKGKYGR